MRGVLDTTLCDKVNFVSDLWQVGNFLRVLWFSPTNTDSRDTIAFPVDSYFSTST